MRKQENMTLPKKHKKFPVTNHKEMEIYKFPDEEFKIMVLR